LNLAAMATATSCDLGRDRREKISRALRFLSFLHAACETQRNQGLRNMRAKHSWEHADLEEGEELLVRVLLKVNKLVFHFLVGLLALGAGPLMVCQSHFISEVSGGGKVKGKRQQTKQTKQTKQTSTNKTKQTQAQNQKKKRSTQPFLQSAKVTLDLQKRHLEGDAGNHGTWQSWRELVCSLGDDAAELGVAKAHNPIVLVLVLSDQ